MIIEGRVWKYDVPVSATGLFPARYDKLAMKRDWMSCARYLLADIDPEFSGQVRPGDVLVVGLDFGQGHAHYFGAGINACLAAGIGAVFARSINGLFFRASTDLGLRSWSYPDVVTGTAPGDRISVDLPAGLFRNLTSGLELQLAPLPPLIADIFEAGSATKWALRKSRETTG